jgi:RNA polymerase sigma factor (sigma-70 family)
MGVGFEAGTDDAGLLAAASSDPEAFARFYDRYEQAITGFFVRRTSTPEAAADLTAEVFTAALTAAGRYRPEGSTAAVWLFTIARNTLRSSIRRGRVEDRARRRAGMMPVVLEDDTLARLTRADGDLWVRQMLDRLPDEQRDAIRARVLQERDYGDIAHELKTSEMVVRKRVSRGLAALREHMERP